MGSLEYTVRACDWQESLGSPGGAWSPRVAPVAEVTPGLEDICLRVLTRDEEKGRGSGNIWKVKLAALGADRLEKGER